MATMDNFTCNGNNQIAFCFMLVVGASYKGPSHHTMYLRASLAYQFKYEYRLSAL